MPRIARVVAAGLPHHVTQRGNRQQEVFLDDADRRLYLDLLARYREKHGLEIFAYCLMSNHVHLVCVPKSQHSLARTLADTHMRYAQHFNRKYSQSGHLWQGRFFSCILDEMHTLAAVRYVERNPVRAGSVARPWDYLWSSTRGHMDEMDRLLSRRWPPKDLLMEWREFVARSETHSETDEIRRSTLAGNPLGSPDFLNKLERVLGRKLRKSRRGRPSKSLKKHD